MITSPTYVEFLQKLSRDFTTVVIDGKRDLVGATNCRVMLSHEESINGPKTRILDLDKVKMVGLLLGQPEAPLMKSELIPRLPYFHCRSGTNINFYFAGYSTSPP